MTHRHSSHTFLLCFAWAPGPEVIILQKDKMIQWWNQWWKEKSFIPLLDGLRRWQLRQTYMHINSTWVSVDVCAHINRVPRNVLYILNIFDIYNVPWLGVMRNQCACSCYVSRVGDRFKGQRQTKPKTWIKIIWKGKQEEVSRSSVNDSMDNPWDNNTEQNGSTKHWSYTLKAKSLNAQRGDVKTGESKQDTLGRQPNDDSGNMN